MSICVSLAVIVLIAGGIYFFLLGMASLDRNDTQRRDTLLKLIPKKRQ